MLRQKYINRVLPEPERPKTLPEKNAASESAHDTLLAGGGGGGWGAGVGAPGASPLEGKGPRL